MTIEQLRQLEQNVANNKGKNLKYNNVKVEVDGEKYDSKKEAERYGILKLLEKRGEIANLKHHEVFPLMVNGQLICKYEADFTYNKGKEFVVEDVKSKVTRTLPVYRIKKKLMKAIWGHEIKEV